MSPTDVVVAGPVGGQGALCEQLLRGLPDWFGIEDAIVEYRRVVDDLPAFVAEADGQAAGLLAVRPTSPAALELHVMAVRRALHRRGIGRALLERAADYARAEGYGLLHVKTQAPEIDDAGYAGTRAFYEALGFAPLEVFSQIWSPEDPCLVMVRPLALTPGRPAA
jgi:GNAT superfamily N-acetyltransferase